jgi:S-adenosylmethionine/arginine decarboxylase-like enzyme
METSDTEGKSKVDYGKELILDLHNCDSSKFTRKCIKEYFLRLCKLIHMHRCKLTFWDDLGIPIEERQKEAHTRGTSAVQFILTSNITIHTLDDLGAVFLNIFSCKDFSANKAAKFSQSWFSGTINHSIVVTRGREFMKGRGQ